MLMEGIPMEWCSVRNGRKECMGIALIRKKITGEGSKVRDPEVCSSSQERKTLRRKCGTRLNAPESIRMVRMRKIFGFIH